ncbi:MAG TPA: tRNA (adenosine(37)-N6)-threonylcarbamoyltransferase complex transferase subunit TsaD [Bacteroidales bacterium]|nr:tRNA (adenosine(37)-N6)-threonylcarbamoyltransferase complex transferase subunit TsaD [Bacteroidales bacterium]
MKLTILGIESSCDDTSAAIIEDGLLLSNKIANQQVHKEYGGVVPELASRAHQQNIIPVVDAALKEADCTVADIDAIAYTRGPGLMGSLLVGSSFAKGLSLSLRVPLIDVNHLLAHILSVFILKSENEKPVPRFPFLCLVVSGGHTLLVVMKDYLDMHIIGQTIDDAAGEAFDKCAKVMGFPYPGGPLIDKYAKEGNANAFEFSKASVKGLDFSFSGLKTSFLYFLRDRMAEDREFMANNTNDLCASIQKAIIDSLTRKLVKAAGETGIHDIAVVGGVSANSGLRQAVYELGAKRKWNVFIPPLQYATDNAAMIAITGYYKARQFQYSSHNLTPVARFDQF